MRYSGIEAALAANMKAVGVGYAKDHPKVHYGVRSLREINIDKLLE